MNLPLSVEQVAALQSASVSEASAIGISRAKLWDTAMECLRLCGRFDDDELHDLIGTAQQQLEFRVGCEKAYQACVEAGREIDAIPAEYCAKDDQYWSGE